MYTPSNDKLLCRVLSGPLTPELSSELDDWLREDPQNPVLLAQFMLLENLIPAVRKEFSAESILALLLQLENDAEPIYITQDVERTLRKKAGAIVHDPLVRLFACVACVVIVVSGAFWALSTLIAANTASTAPQIADQQVQADETLVTDERIVAMLTASYNATWAMPDGMSDPTANDALHPGDRLTLTAGFAEITTNRGAVALLEAPTTIELFDNDNAMRLHDGKLIGFCETASSKGFIVRTDDADITDLGTKFGVIADHETGTLMHVFSGSISAGGRADTVNANKQLLLKAGQSAVANPNDGLVSKPEAAAAFLPKIDLSAADLPITAAYTQAVKQLNPLAYYRFEERVGNEFRNEMGDRFTLSCFGDVVSKGSDANRSAVFEDGFLETRQAIAPLTHGDYTIEFWARSEHEIMCHLITLKVTSKLTNAVLTFEPALRFEHRADPSNSAGSGDTISSGILSKTGQWQHVVAVRSGQEIRLYVNTVLVGTAESPRPLSTAPQLKIGSNTKIRSPLQLDEIAVYDKALSEQQVREHFRLIANDEMRLRRPVP